MDEVKEKVINATIDEAMCLFADSLKQRGLKEIDNPKGVINRKKNNVFVAELGAEFMFYSALVRSFDSSFGTVLERLGNDIAKMSYRLEGDIDSYILPAQEAKINELVSAYTTDADNRVTPDISHYNAYTCIKPKNIESYRRQHATDHHFYNEEKDEHYLVELKAGGDLDNKKAPAEKRELLYEYFLLKNKLEMEGKVATIKIFFAAAYNKDGEGNYWNQTSVRNSFAPDELLIGKDYWNFICNDDCGFDIVMKQYKKSAAKIRKALSSVKQAYFPV